MITHEEILNKFGLKYEQLTEDERSTFHTMLNVINQGALSIDKLRTHIASMKYAVEDKLVDTPEFKYILCFRVFNRKHIFLKARLRNYMLLEAFLLTPEKAKEALDKMLAGMVGKK